VDRNRAAARQAILAAADADAGIVVLPEGERRDAHADRRTDLYR
jgi:polygalacturonase